jgi:ssRNA-specific RNase YbeY (16S rRNA maturation enzyme)
MTKQYKQIKDAILGEAYDLSLVLADKKLATELHKKWKKIPGPANILSFPLAPDTGEIFLYKDPEKSKGELLSLFIHGCVHLKGFTHGSKMDKEEAKWRKVFDVR